MSSRRLAVEERLLYGGLPVELSENLRSVNPWWGGLPGMEVPAFKRWPFGRLKRLITKGMTPATVLRGPRRVGKTILLRQLIESLVAEGVSPQRLLYVPFDELPTLRDLKEPVLDIARWYEGEILRATFNEAARKSGTAYLLLDEVQNLDAWAPQVKNLVDNHSVRVLVTGSSSLRIESGWDSLAGRITTLDVGPLFLREIADLRQGVDSPPSDRKTAWSTWPNGSSGWRPSSTDARLESAGTPPSEPFRSAEPIPSRMTVRMFHGKRWPTS